jgi:hypothetical protein
VAVVSDLTDPEEREALQAFLDGLQTHLEQLKRDLEEAEREAGLSPEPPPLQLVRDDD